MKTFVPIYRRPVIALVAVVFAVGSVQAQAPAGPGSTQYPYWATAPQSFAPSQVTVPVPQLSPFTISNAARAAPTPSNIGVGLGGGFIPPFLTAKAAAADNKAHIWLRVPENAEIWVNDVKTKQTGESRYFFSPPLTPGKKYNYQVRFRWTKDGKPVEETQNIQVRAGDTIRRDLTTK